MSRGQTFIITLFVSETHVAGKGKIAPGFVSAIDLGKGLSDPEGPVER